MKGKLKISILDFDDINNPLLGAGQARATFEVARRLVEMGHEVEVISSRYPNSKDKVQEGIIYRHIGLGSKYIRLNNLVYILVLPFYVRRIKGDIVVECFTAPVTTLFSPLFTKIPAIATSTSFEAERFAQKYHLPFHLIQNFGLRFYKYFLPSSKFFEEKIKKINPQVNCRVVPLGIDKSYFQIKQKGNKFILFLGRMDMGQKGIDLLLSAYKKAEAKIELPLVMVGNGPDEGKVAGMIKDMDLTAKIKMVGPVFGEEKFKYYSKAAYMIVPSRHEGFCIAALEGLASGLPVLAFDIPGLTWIGRAVSKKVAAFDIDKLALAMTKFEKQDVLRRYKKRCKKFAKSFTWEKVAEEFEKYFYFVIENEKKN